MKNEPPVGSIVAGQAYQDTDPFYGGERFIVVQGPPEGVLGMVPVISNRGRRTKIRAERLLSASYKRREDLDVNG